MKLKILFATVMCLCILEIARVDAWRRRRRRRRSCSAVNCAWGEWQEWGACSITCGNNGQQRRIRTESRSASCGGAACTGPCEEQRACSPGCIRGTAIQGRCVNCPFPYTGNCCEQFIQGDPCTTHIELSQPWRSINYPPEQDNSYRYTTILNYWYRFVGEGGGDMPTTCVKATSCGVLKPIWMSGEHPTSNEGAVCRTACTSVSDNGEDNCCIRTNTIEVKNCADNFFVYKLFQPQDCDEGFCAGKEEPCPPRTKSANGFTPGCMADPPPDRCRPEPILEYIRRAGEFQFICRFNVQYQRNVTYDVNWYAGGVVLGDFATSVFGSTTGSTALGVQQLRSVMTSSTTITCSLAARYVHVDDGTPMSEATPPKESNALAFVVT